ncbi:RagB/SusD family nutrient uptake outer membrane protein [Butyricimonas synergistica]|uniref:RagB/SusD family nutrient uptake outer membrane protein n=1 Tax=Butyricimonas synergistica TaxID=544644 RepID=UPI00037FE0CB|nr:RagB/SusD family nutrient uptake outer membrane protein [Butyricimonas synergistica]
MKVISIISTIFILALTSCNSWLDITPQDTVDEDKLFATGDGYRNVLNGVYKQMATSSMYGQELSWGMLDVMAQLYQSRAFGSATNYYKIITKYNYEDRDIKPVIQTIWSQAYNSIANCNSLLSKIDETDSTLFRALNHEKLLIKGEALALRAFLHFDLLRLFAPAPVTKNTGTHIPYFTTYPSTFEPDRTVKEVLELAIKDLEEAKNLVAPHDTLDWRYMLTDAQRIHYDGLNPKANPDLFFKNRGFRMNYLAVCALLARVYNYMGELDATYYQKSYDMAEHVLTFAIDPNSYRQTLDFTKYYYTDKNKKRYEEILFCLSNQKLMENYELLTSSNSPKIKFYLQSPGSLFDDNADARWTELIEASGSYQICTKNIAPSGDIGEFKYCQDMLPMIRLGELYYIQAEHLCRQGDIQGAIEKLDKVRYARNCQTGSMGEMSKKIKDLESFKQQMAKEALREFMQEGQAFFYYKRFNIFPKTGMKDADMILPKPENETIH